MTNANNHRATRNRRNALLSTGPSTPAGKARSRSNSLKHGLTANPAAGVVENPTAFYAMLQDLITRIEPRDPVEAGLVHRIATCLWRLQRAARIDAACSNLAAASVVPLREQVQHWINRIGHLWWDVRYYEETNADELRRGRERLIAPSKGPWMRFCRPALAELDQMRQQELMADPAGLQAMAQMLIDLVQRLKTANDLLPVEAQMLAWLLGEQADRFENDSITERERDGHYFPDEKSWASEVDQLIGVARTHRLVSRQLQAKVHHRLLALRQQQLACRDTGEAQDHANRQVASLLPDDNLLDRLLRYESHADRALHRSLDALARYRGTAIQTVMARVKSNHPDGSSIEVQARNSHRSPGFTRSAKQSAKRSQMDL